MITNNSINLSDAGVVSYDGAGDFTGSPITQYNTLVAGANNEIVSVPPSTAGFVLTSNGAAVNPSFQVIPAKFSSINIQTFTSSGTYTPTAGMAYCIIEVVGGGGAGGGSNSVITLTGSCGGGGSGGYARGFYSSATIGASQTITIGAGGLGISATTGQAGGTTSVGSLISSTGGGGGLISVPVTGGDSFPGAGGVGSGGNFSVNGNYGFYGDVSPISSTANGGNGGSTLFGGAGGPVFAISGTSINGNSASSYGGGGGGSSYYLSATAAKGGDGFSGIVIITEYIST